MQSVAINTCTTRRPVPAQQALLPPQRPAQDRLASGELYRDMCQGMSDQIDDLPALRLVAVPDVGPPFDGEPQVSAGPVEYWRQGRTEEIDALAVPSDPVTSATAIGQLEGPGEWPRQFARLLAEALSGARPVRQILPWTSDRARGQLHRLTPLFGGGQRPRVLRVIATRPSREVIEMSVIVSVGTRTRALAIRLEHMTPRRHLSRLAERAANGVRPAPMPLRWVCTDIEAA